MLELSLFGTLSAPPPATPAVELHAPVEVQPQLKVIPAAELRDKLTAAGWPEHEQQRLLDALADAQHIPTPGTAGDKGCPRYPVAVHVGHAVLVEPAYAYDPLTGQPKAKPIEEGHIQRFWRLDVDRPGVTLAKTPDHQRRAS